MEFHEKRRQQFLGENYYREQLRQFADVLHGEEGLEANLLTPERSRGWYAELQRGIGFELFNRMLLRYTAGEPIEQVRLELEQVVVAYERYGQRLWAQFGDRNEVVFPFTSLDDYCQLMQLIGLCFLLHRRDLLPRVAALQDGLDAVGQVGEGNGGTDTLYEEFMAFGVGPQTRFETDWLCCSKPYKSLFHALTEPARAEQLKELDLFLKHWYKDLAGTGWHDSHKPNENGDQGGYYGYWSFEAGAAVLLLGIEDDSSLHRYLYYPKDMVAWAREHAALSEGQGATAPIRLRAAAGEPCPREGYWFTPAKQNSRRYFKQGEVMPDTQSRWGATIWQWDETQ